MSQRFKQDSRPVLIVPYVWIGDFVRCHSVVRLLREKNPDRPVDIVSNTLCAPLADYMPGVRRAVVIDLPRGKLGIALHRQLADMLREENYGQAIVMSRKWKAALAPWLAGIPVRTGFAGEGRFGLLNDLRFGEKRLPRMIDQMGALALPKDSPLPGEWPLPELKVPAKDMDAWSKQLGITKDNGPVVALSPGAVGIGKAWPAGHYCELARRLASDVRAIWILGGPNETPIAKEIVEAAGARARDLTGPDLRNAILALAMADIAVTNDSGLMHVSAALDMLTIAIFGPTSPWHWKPLNPIAAILEPAGDEGSRERARIDGNVAVRHRRTDDVAVETVLKTVHKLLAEAKNRARRS
jgi:heptosyltransferase-2